MSGIFDKLGFPFIGNYGHADPDQGDGGKPTPLDSIVALDRRWPWPGDMMRDPKNYKKQSEE